MSELRVRFPVALVEGLDTDDGRHLAVGGVTHRPLPLPLLAVWEANHGGNDPDAAEVVGRVDMLMRVPGPEVISPATGEPFPEGVWVWAAEGVIDGAHPVADLVRRRFLRGVSADLVGMQWMRMSEDDEGPEVASAASVGGLTIVPMPAFADTYLELVDDEAAQLEDLDVEAPEFELVASGFPSWRTPERDGYTLPESAAGLAADGDAEPDARTRCFYDTEFIEDGSTIDLISIGIVADDGREYYAMRQEADLSKAGEWVQANVIPTLPVVDGALDPSDERVKPGSVIADEVREFLTSNGEAELWAYFGAYDHVALCQLWGVMSDLPEGVPMYTRDIKQAADEAGVELPEQPSGEHDALEDARFNVTRWEAIQSGGVPVVQASADPAEVPVSGPEPVEAVGTPEPVVEPVTEPVRSFTDPQPCIIGDHPASVSLAAGTRYAPTCDEHEPYTRERLEPLGTVHRFPLNGDPA